MEFVALDLVRLHSGIRGMTPNLIRLVLDVCQRESIPLSDIFTMGLSDLRMRFPKITPKVAEQLAVSDRDVAQKTLDQLEAKGFRILTYLDDAYPKKYHQFGTSMPPLLYVYGDLSIIQKTGISFGGARNVSREGLHATDKLVKHAVRDYGHVIISGHAKGVDTIAHQAALERDGETVLVLPEGVLKFRLRNDLRVYWKEAKDRIVVMSQFPPHQPWQVSNAMKRNATAICLSEAFCVIESGDETGGTWQAGLTALKHNVPLYVLDYDDPPESALGNQKLIQKGGVSIHHNNLVFPSKNGTMDTGLTQKSLW